MSEGPKYRRIAADLRARIRSGEFPGGSALPPQRRLGEEYDVTLMTVRQALQVLEADGLIAQQAGRGTYVLPSTPAHHLQSLRSLADELATQGVALRTDVLSRSERRLPRDVVADAGPEGDGRGLRLERLRSVGGRAVLHQVSWVPQPWGSEVRDCDFTVEPLYVALARVCGLTVDSAQETLAAAALPVKVAERVGLTAGHPVLQMRRVTVDPAGRPFLVDVALVLDERLRVVTERRAGSVTNSWQLG